MHVHVAVSPENCYILVSFQSIHRSLVKNLVLGYIHTTDRKKPEVLQLIGKILEFSPEELEEAKGVATGNAGWLTGFWKRSTTTSNDKVS